jgi:uncharacterized protein
MSSGAAPGDMKPRYVMDSSVWVEYYLGNSRIRELTIDRLRAKQIVVPSICICEVALSIERRIGEEMMHVVVANMREQVVDDLTASRAISAAQLRNEHRLSVADAIVYATSVAHRATLISHDKDFEGMPNVMYLKPTS